MARLTSIHSWAAWVGIAATVVIGLPACSGSSDGDNEGAGASGNGGSSSGSGSSSGAGSALNLGGSGDSSGTGATGAGGATAAGCQKIDFLFIVDNSVSMENEQSQLVAAFPGFISTIEATVNAGSDTHVMVVDTDEWGRCNTANPWTGESPGSDTCNAYVNATVFEECDRTIGAGVIHPAGEHASNKICNFAAGRRFLQQGDSDVASTFGCAAQVGVAGNSSERPMDALVAAMSSTINGPGGCNQGFLRDDAVLVVTFISDDPNYEDAGTPKEWYDAVVQAKHGDPNAVVMVGFTPAFDGCQDGKKPPKGSHWAEFVKMFPYSLHASACSADYVDVFTQAVNIIDQSCDGYTPPAIK